MTTHITMIDGTEYDTEAELAAYYDEREPKERPILKDVKAFSVFILLGLVDMVILWWAVVGVIAVFRWLSQLF